jgi:hypothetical protein
MPTLFIVLQRIIVQFGLSHNRYQCLLNYGLTNGSCQLQFREILASVKMLVVSNQIRERD